MATARSGYGSDHYTTASGPEPFEVDRGPSDYLEALLRRPRGGGGGGREQLRAGRPSYTPNPYGGAPVGFGGRGVSSAEKALPGMEARHRIKQMQTLEQGPPVEHRYSGGTYLGLQPKTETMTGLQRQAFLPGGSSEVGAAMPSRASEHGFTGLPAPVQSRTRADFFGTGSNDPGVQDEISNRRTTGRDAERDQMRRFLMNLYGAGGGGS